VRDHSGEHRVLGEVHVGPAREHVQAHQVLEGRDQPLLPLAELAALLRHLLGLQTAVGLQHGAGPRREIQQAVGELAGDGLGGKVEKQAPRVRQVHLNRGLLEDVPMEVQVLHVAEGPLLDQQAVVG